MEDLIEEIEKAINAELYLSALYLVMAIPDICSAVESGNYETTQGNIKNGLMIT